VLARDYNKVKELKQAGTFDINVVAYYYESIKDGRNRS
jgi:hypothetical protein